MGGRKSGEGERLGRASSSIAGDAARAKMLGCFKEATGGVSGGKKAQAPITQHSGNGPWWWSSPPAAEWSSIVTETDISATDMSGQQW